MAHHVQRAAPIEPVEPRMVSCFMKHPELSRIKSKTPPADPQGSTERRFFVQEIRTASVLLLCLPAPLQFLDCSISQFLYIVLRTAIVVSLISLSFNSAFTLSFASRRSYVLQHALVLLHHERFWSDLTTFFRQRRQRNTDVATRRVRFRPRSDAIIAFSTAGDIER